MFSRIRKIFHRRHAHHPLQASAHSSAAHGLSPHRRPVVLPLKNTISDSENEGSEVGDASPGSAHFPHQLPQAAASDGACAAAFAAASATTSAAPAAKLPASLQQRLLDLYQAAFTASRQAVPLLPHDVGHRAYPGDTTVRYANRARTSIIFQTFDDFMERREDRGLRLRHSGHGMPTIESNGRTLSDAEEVARALDRVAVWLGRQQAPTAAGELNAAQMKRRLKSVARDNPAAYVALRGRHVIRLGIHVPGMDNVNAPNVVRDADVVVKLDNTLNPPLPGRQDPTTTPRHLTDAMIQLGSMRIMHRLGLGPRQAVHIVPNADVQVELPNVPAGAPVRRTLAYTATGRLYGSELVGDDWQRQPGERPVLSRQLALVGFVLGANDIVARDPLDRSRPVIHNVMVDAGGRQRAFELFAFGGRNPPQQRPDATSVSDVLGIGRDELLARVEDGRRAAIFHLQRHAETLRQDTVFREQRQTIVDGIHAYFDACGERVRQLDD